MILFVRHTALGCALLFGFAPATLHAAEEYLVEMSYRTAGFEEHGSSSSQGHQILLERVLFRSDDSLIIEYDLPPEATDEERARQWQLPMRVRKLADGTSELLNESKLAARIDPWLEHAGMPREACGTVIFTWNAFRIYCDPSEALAVIQPFDLRIGPIEEGTPIGVAGAKEPGSLVQVGLVETPSVYMAILEIDPDYVLEQSARTDVAVAELSGKSLTFESALAEREDEQVSGSAIVSLNVDDAGDVVRRTDITTIVTLRSGGNTETNTQYRTVRRVSAPALASKE